MAAITLTVDGKPMVVNTDPTTPLLVALTSGVASSPSQPVG